MYCTNMLDCYVGADIYDYIKAVVMRWMFVTGKSKTYRKFRYLFENDSYIWECKDKPIFIYKFIRNNRKIIGCDININPADPDKDRVDMEIRGCNIRIIHHDSYGPVFTDENVLTSIKNELVTVLKCLAPPPLIMSDTSQDFTTSDKEEIKMFGIKRTYAFDLKPGTPVRVKYKDMYGLESDVPTLKDILGSKMAEDKYCDAIVLNNINSGSRIALVTCNTNENISVAFVLDINDINNNKIELIELIPKEDSNE